LVQKIKDSNIQITKTSNDRFVMNSVPLEHWSLIQRKPNKAVFMMSETRKNFWRIWVYRSK